MGRRSWTSDQEQPGKAHLHSYVGAPTGAPVGATGAPNMFFYCIIMHCSSRADSEPVEEVTQEQVLEQVDITATGIPMYLLEEKHNQADRDRQYQHIIDTHHTWLSMLSQEADVRATYNSFTWRPTVKLVLKAASQIGLHNDKRYNNTVVNTTYLFIRHSRVRRVRQRVRHGILHDTCFLLLANGRKNL